MDAMVIRGGSSSKRRAAVSSRTQRESITTAAVDRGFVALPIDAYLRSRILGANELDERTLLLVDVSGGDPWRAHAALLRCVGAIAPSASSADFSPRTWRQQTSIGARSARQLPSGTGRTRITANCPPGFARIACTRVCRLRPPCRRRAAASRCRRCARSTRCLSARLTPEHHAGQASERTRTDEGSIRDARGSHRACANRPGRRPRARGTVWQATTRIADAAFVEAEALCRAVLEAPRLPPELKTWTLAVLADALLWQGRLGDTTDFEADGLSALDPVAAAEAYQIKVRLLLAQGRGFDAGRCVGRLKTLASHAKDMTVHAIANIADLALLAASGDLARASHAFGAAAATSRTAKTPFRAAWARLLWVDMLRRAGCSEAARPHLDRLSRLARAAPLLLQREIGRRLSGDDLPTVSTSRAPQLRPSALSVALLRAAHEDDDDKEAIRRLIDTRGT